MRNANVPNFVSNGRCRGLTGAPGNRPALTGFLHACIRPSWKNKVVNLVATERSLRFTPLRGARWKTEYNLRPTAPRPKVVLATYRIMDSVSFNNASTFDFFFRSVSIKKFGSFGRFTVLKSGVHHRSLCWANQPQHTKRYFTIHAVYVCTNYRTATLSNDFRFNRLATPNSTRTSHYNGFYFFVLNARCVFSPRWRTKVHGIISESIGTLADDACCERIGKKRNAESE